MYLITVPVGNAVWCLLYKEQKNAESAFNTIDAMAAPVCITDDFGQTLQLSAPPAGMLYEDLEQSKLAQIERMLHQARTQARAQSLASADPGLRSGVMGPAPISPFMRGN